MPSRERIFKDRTGRIIPKEQVISIVRKKIAETMQKDELVDHYVGTLNNAMLLSWALDADKKFPAERSDPSVDVVSSGKISEEGHEEAE